MWIFWALVIGLAPGIRAREGTNDAAREHAISHIRTTAHRAKMVRRHAPSSCNENCERRAVAPP
jgi:hypothetical protein